MPSKAEKKAAQAKREKKEAHARREKEIAKKRRIKEAEKLQAKERAEAQRRRAKKKKENLKKQAEVKVEAQKRRAQKKKENQRKQAEATAEAHRRKKEAKKKHNIAFMAARQRKKELAEARALRAPALLQESKEAQAEAIVRHQREVELTFDISSMEEQIREMLSKHGEIESLKKNIKGGLDVRFATREAAESLLKKKKNTTINASLMFPVTPVVIKQHCLYYMPQGYVIDQEVLNATAEYFSSISVVQQVKKLRNAVLIVFEDEATRDQMVKQSAKTNWKILDRLIGPCHAGLPPAINKRKRKGQNQPNKKKRSNQNTNGVQH